MTTKRTNIHVNIRPNYPRGYCIDVYRMSSPKGGKRSNGPQAMAMPTEERYLARTVEEVETAISQLYRTGKTTI